MANEKRLIAVDEWDTFFAEHIYNRCFRSEYEQGYTDALDRVDDWMDDHPTVDAVEVKHGRWVDKMVRDWHCSECGKKVPRQVWFDGYCYNDKLNYCPNCGAKMDGDGNG